MEIVNYSNCFSVDIDNRFYIFPKNYISANYSLGLNKIAFVNSKTGLEMFSELRTNITPYNADLDVQLGNISNIIFKAFSGGGGSLNVENGTANGNTLRWENTSWTENLRNTWLDLPNYYKIQDNGTLIEDTILQGDLFNNGVDLLYSGLQENLNTGIKQIVKSWQGTSGNAYIGLTDFGFVGMLSDTNSFVGEFAINPGEEKIIISNYINNDPVHLQLNLDKSSNTITAEVKNDSDIDDVAGLILNRTQSLLKRAENDYLIFNEIATGFSKVNSQADSEFLLKNINGPGGGVSLVFENKAAPENDLFMFKYDTEQKTLSVSLEEINNLNGLQIIQEVNLTNGINFIVNRLDEINTFEDRSLFTINENLIEFVTYNTNDSLNGRLSIYKDESSINSSSSQEITQLTLQPTNATFSYENIDLGTFQSKLTLDGSAAKIISRDGTDQIIVQFRTAKNAGGSMININGGIPEYADNTAALAGGCVVGDIYETPDGTLRRVR